jgi:plasmid maintenance system killer protein
MIRSFADRATERLFRDGVCPARWRTIETVALRKLDMVEQQHAWMIYSHRRATGWKR